MMTESLPHARGGVSMAMTTGLCAVEVFPTLVGVFLIRFYLTVVCFGLPHARGGVSGWLSRTKLPALSSPRSWGCFCIRVNFLQ